jgi:glucosamine-phosphate N-acetyltransferase
MWWSLLLPRTPSEYEPFSGTFKRLDQLVVWAMQIVGTGTLFVERKLLHNGGLAGHIEDVVVDSTIRGILELPVVRASLVFIVPK